MDSTCRPSSSAINLNEPESNEEVTASSISSDILHHEHHKAESSHSCLVTLCIKLPNGDRICHRFNYATDQIITVMSFAHSFLNCEEKFNPNRACLSDNSVPKTVYTNHILTLSEAGLIHNTLLHYSLL